jgi:hypothetical protein
MFDYLSMLSAVSDYIESFRKEIVKVFFEETEKTKSEFVNTPLYQSYWAHLNNIVNVSDVLGIEGLQNCKAILSNNLNFLIDREFPCYKATFQECLRDIGLNFQEAKEEIREKLTLLEEDEWIRLNEALNCYIEELNYSAVVMSVSAVESRLYTLMVCKNPNEEQKLKKLTLGELIKEYLSNTQKYSRVVLNKHLPLLKFCNVYRIFSVHPKKEKITRANATAIMSMTCSFLFDKEQKAKIQEEK